MPVLFVLFAEPVMAVSEGRADEEDEEDREDREDREDEDAADEGFDDDAADEREVDAVPTGGRGVPARDTEVDAETEPDDVGAAPVVCSCGAGLVRGRTVDVAPEDGSAGAACVVATRDVDGVLGGGAGAAMMPIYSPVYAV